MYVIIAGSRTINDYELVCKAIENSGFKNILAVFSGTANGVDKLGERWAKENNKSIFRFPANWDRHGKSAGYIRNEQMAKTATALIAIWDGTSRGTEHMINMAKKHNLKIYVERV